MTRARAALLLLSLSSLLATGVASRSHAAAVGPRHGGVIVILVDGVSFDDVMDVPEFQRLAARGGAALMTTRSVGTDRERSSYRTIGSGSASADSRPHLLAEILRRRGVDVCTTGKQAEALVGPGDQDLRTACTGMTDELIVLDARFFAEVLSGRTGTSEKDLAAIVGTILQMVVSPQGLGHISPRTMVFLLSPLPSSRMDRIGDEVTPLVIASARPDNLLSGSGAPRALRSDTTRQTGLVANVDVAPTILDFFGIPIPAEMDGQPIEFTSDPAPFELHRLHLEQRRIRLPIQLAEVAFVSASGAVAIVVLLVAARRRSLPRRLGEAMRFVTLCVAALPIPLILGGVLPRLTYWVVVPFVVLSVGGLAILALSARWPGVLGPFIFLATFGLAVVVVDALLGWRGARIPLLGGTMFDGARFYGLPNAFLCLLLAGALFVAAALPAFTGFLVLVGAGLFAGFPSLGADVGGTITLFFAAGLWWVLRTRPQLGLREVAFVAGVTAMGLGVVLLANRYLPGIPTHATRFVEGTGNGLGDVLREFGARSSIGFDQARKAPAAWIPLIGLPVLLALVLTRPGPIGWGLEMAGKRWQQALVVLTLAGMVAFFVNDTGLAAAAPVFLFAMSGMAYPAFVAATRGGGLDSSSQGGPDGEGYE